MWLKNGDHSALVSPQGGSILQWQYKEHMILGPTRMVRVGEELKARGESHWCYPNFGTPPPEWFILGKHGPFRKNLLTPRFDETSQIASFYNGGLIGIKSKVSYNLGLDGLEARLSVQQGRSDRFPILPAFHPYFAVPASGETLRIQMGGEDLCWATSRNSRGVSSEARVIERNDKLVEVLLTSICRVTIEPSDDCTHIVIWSDKPWSYVCVEPIFGKPGTFGKPEGRWIEPGDRIECGVRLDFEAGK